MSARKKLNGLYPGAAAVLAAFVGVVFNSWAAFAVTLGVMVVIHTHAGNVRWAAGRPRLPPAAPGPAGPSASFM
jgi:hypothetical protein